MAQNRQSPETSSYLNDEIQARLDGNRCHCDCWILHVQLRLCARPRAASAWRNRKRPGSLRGVLSKNSNPPVYPPDELRDGIEGTVIIIVKVNEYGEFLRAFVDRSSKNRQLDQAALEAARHWRYNPAVYDGMPQSDSIRIPVDFDLEKYWEAHPDATSEQAKSFYPPVDN